LHNNNNNNNNFKARSWPRGILWHTKPKNSFRNESFWPSLDTGTITK